MKTKDHFKKIDEERRKLHCQGLDDPDISAAIKLAKETQKRGWWHGLDIGKVVNIAENLAEALLLGEE